MESCFRICRKFRVGLPAHTRGREEASNGASSGAEIGGAGWILEDMETQKLVLDISLTRSRVCLFSGRQKDPDSVG